MKFRLLKFIVGLVLFFALIFSISSQSDPNLLTELETRLPKSSGRVRIEILVTLARSYANIKPIKSIQYGNEARSLMDKLPTPDLEVPLLNAFSTAYIFSGEYTIAEEYANKSMAIAQERGDREGFAHAIFRLGHLNFFRSNYSLAIEHLNRSLELYKKTGDWKGMADSLNVTGTVFWKLHDYSTALEKFINAADLYEKVNNNQGIANTYNNIGLIHLEMGNLEKALEHFSKTREILEMLGDKMRNAGAISNIAIVYYQQGNYRESLKLNKKALKISEEINDPFFAGSCLHNIGDIYDKIDENDEALKCYNRSLKIRETIENREGIAEILIDLSRLKRKLKKYQEAFQHANRALAIASGINSKALVMNSYEELSEILGAQKDYTIAFSYYKKYKEISDTIFNEDNSQKVAELQTRFDLEKKEKEIILLKKDNEIQHLDYTKQKNLKKSYFIISILVLMLVFVMYARFRLKLKANRALTREIRQHEITLQKLRESEEKFRALAEKSVAGIYIIQDDRFKYVNPKYLEIYGYTDEEIIGQNHLMTVWKEDQELVRENIRKRLMGEVDAINYQFRGVTKQGEMKYVEIFGIRVNYQGGPAIMGTLIDFTQRKKAEEELMRSQKLESIGILAGGIAHDFNNLLTIISGNISLSIEEIKNDFHIAPMLKSAEKSSLQAADLVQKLITFSKGDWLEPQKVTLSSILDNTVNYYPSLKPIFQRIALFIPPDLDPIRGDERQLRQVIANLLQNAWESAESAADRVRITIAAQNINLDARTAKSISLKEGDYVRVSVSDNGKGISKDLLQYIFDPYFSTKGTVTQKGLGLGLAICYTIVKRHLGYIGVDSEEGKGTTVNIYLPANK